MRLESKKYLYDISTAADRIATFTVGKTLPAYQNDDMLRAAVERQFEIIGEALSQLAHINPELVGSISEYRRIISFRNILIHAYAEVDDLLVWDVVVSKLPLLRREISSLLEG